MPAAVTATTRHSSQRRAARAGTAGRIRWDRVGRIRWDRVGRIRWDRVGRIALLGMLGMILLLYASPAKHWLEQSSTRSAQREELSRLNAEKAGLKRKVRAFSNAGSLEQEARRLGMIKRGERSYVIENPPR